MTNLANITLSQLEAQRAACEATRRMYTGSYSPAERAQLLIDDMDRAKARKDRAAWDAARAELITLVEQLPA